MTNKIKSKRSNPSQDRSQRYPRKKRKQTPSFECKDQKIKIARCDEKPLPRIQALIECPLKSNFSPLGSFFLSLSFSVPFFDDLDVLLPTALPPLFSCLSLR
jgi:hypothetical protein